MKMTGTQRKLFAEMIRESELVMMEGSIVERLAHSGQGNLRGPAANAVLLVSEEGRRALRQPYLEYLELGRAHDLPVLLLTPTWRANRERLAAAGLPDVVTISCLAAEFLREIVEEAGMSGSAWIGGLMGCHGDAYKPEESIGEEAGAAFHREQAEALAEAGVDYLMAATLPEAGEAMGITRVMAATGVPAIPSYVINRRGELLDGTPMERVIRRSDEVCEPKPLFHMVNCVHPSVYESAMQRVLAEDPEIQERLLGLQANSSPRTPEELDGIEHLDGDGPLPFASSMASARRATGIKLLGGCCGTSTCHLREMIHSVVIEGNEHP